MLSHILLVYFLAGITLSIAINLIDSFTRLKLLDLDNDKIYKNYLNRHAQAQYFILNNFKFFIIATVWPYYLFKMIKDYRTKNGR